MSLNTLNENNCLLPQLHNSMGQERFNICGNKYRIVVLTDYARHGRLIRFVGTHKQYDEIEDIDNI